MNIKVFGSYMRLCLKDSLLLAGSALAVLLCLSVPQAAEAKAQAKVIEVRAEPWQNFTHADGSGYYYELLTAIYQPLGYELRFKYCPWKRCILDVIQFKADIIIAIYENEEVVGDQLQTSKNYINIETTAVAFKKARQLAWQGQQAMTNKRVVYNRGYNYASLLDVPVNVVEVNNAQQALKVLMADHADYIIAGRPLLEREIPKISNTPNQYQIETVFIEPSYMGYNLSEKGTKLKQEFDQQFEKLYKSGELKKLQQQWMLDFPLLEDAL